MPASPRKRYNVRRREITRRVQKQTSALDRDASGISELDLEIAFGSSVDDAGRRPTGALSHAPVVVGHVGVGAT